MNSFLQDFVLARGIAIAAGIPDKYRSGDHSFFFVKNKDSYAVYWRKGNSFDLCADEENDVSILNAGNL